MRPVWAPLRARAVLIGLALLAAGCRSRPAEPPSAPRPALAAPSERPAVLAELPADPGDPAAQAPDTELVFAELGGGVAWIAGTPGALRVAHGGRAGNPYAELGPIVLSADGRRCAHAARAGETWRMVVDGEEGPPFARVGPPAFSPDGSRVAYEAERAGAWHLVVDGAPGRGGRARYPWHGFGADGSRLAFLEAFDDEGWGRLVVRELASGRETVVEPAASTVVANAARTRLAAIARRDGRQHVVTVALDAPERVARGPAFDAVHALAFGPDGASVGYRAERGGEQLAVLEGREERLAPGDDTFGPPVVRPGGGLGAIVVSGGGVRLRQFLAEGEVSEPAVGGAEGLVYSGDGRSRAYAASQGGKGFVVANGRRGPEFDRVVSPAFGPDGRTLVYRARQAGKRFVVVADAEGRTLRQHPPYEQVFPVRFTADGRSIAYGVRDGRRLAWKVEPLPAP